MRKKHFQIICAVALLFLAFETFPITSYAHPGRTDADGGHWDHSNGTYHYHGTPDKTTSSDSTSSGNSSNSNYGDNGMNWADFITTAVLIIFGGFLLFVFLSCIVSSLRSKPRNESTRTPAVPQITEHSDIKEESQNNDVTADGVDADEKGPLREEFNNKYRVLHQNLQAQVSETNARNNQLLISKLNAIDQEKVRVALQKDNIEKAIEFSKEQMKLLSINKCCDFEELYNSIVSGRLNNAFNSNLSFVDLKISCTIRSEDKYYETSLLSCNCVDYQTRHRPCKHILFLAYSLGILQINREYGEKSADQLINEVNDNSVKLRDLKKRIANYEKKKH